MFQFLEYPLFFYLDSAACEFRQVEGKEAHPVIFRVLLRQKKRLGTVACFVNVGDIREGVEAVVPSGAEHDPSV